MSNIEDDVKILEEFAEICKAGLACYDQTREGEALENILAEREQKDKRIKELEEESEILEFQNKQVENYAEELKKYNKTVSDRMVEYKKNSIPKQVLIDLIKNETIDICGFECVAVEDIQELLEGEK